MQAAQPPRHTEIINVDDEDDEQQSLEDEEINGDGQSYASQSEDQDETMDEGMDGVNGEPASETGSEVSVQGSVEQSNFSLSNKGQGW